MQAPKRTDGRDPGRARVMARDLELLGFIARGQPVTTSQVVMRAGASVAVTRRRLRVLRDHALVRVVVQALEADNLYLLTERGRERLIEAGHDEEGLRTLRSVPRNLAHHAPSAMLLAALTAACARTEALHLAEYLLERDIRRLLGVPQANLLIPDATAVFVSSTGARFAMAIEVDTGTEKNPSWVAERKGRAYAELHTAGAPLRAEARWAVALLVPTKRRLHRLARAIYEAELPLCLFYFVLTPELSSRTVLTPGAWQTLRLDAAASRVRLVNLSPLAALTPSSRAVPRNDARAPGATHHAHTNFAPESREDGDHGS